jgi:hypothetical protein
MRRGAFIALLLTGCARSQHGKVKMEADIESAGK